MNQNQIDLILVDLDTSLTFASIAQGAGATEDKRERNIHHARRGYETIVHLMETAELTDKEKKDIEIKLQDLKSALEGLGQDMSQRQDPYPHSPSHSR
jgi:hypothetical protein